MSVRVPQDNLLKSDVAHMNFLRALATEANAVSESAEATTTDATLTTIWQYAMPANGVGEFWFHAVGRTAGAAAVGGYCRRVVVSRPGTGAVVTIGGGADVIGVDKEDAAAWDVSFALDAANPANIYATVLGAAATTIFWSARVFGLVGGG